MPPCLYLSAANAAKIREFFSRKGVKSFLNSTEGNTLDEVLLQERINAEDRNG